jgi:hypothetical protein
MITLDSLNKSEDEVLETYIIILHLKMRFSSMLKFLSNHLITSQSVKHTAIYEYMTTMERKHLIN